MSEYAVHFTKDTAERNAYDTMLRILWEGRINAANPFGAAKNLAEQGRLGDSQNCACFSEIPLDLLDRLIDRRSMYGIGFRQDVLLAQGGGRVWYTDQGSAPAHAVEELVRQAMEGHVDPADVIWKTTRFIDRPGQYGGTQYRFEWEREWRVPRGLTFSPAEVDFLFIPEDLHGRARDFFEGAKRTTPAPPIYAHTSTHVGTCLRSKPRSKPFQHRRRPLVRSSSDPRRSTSFGKLLESRAGERWQPGDRKEHPRLAEYGQIGTYGAHWRNVGHLLQAGGRWFEPGTAH